MFSCTCVRFPFIKADARDSQNVYAGSITSLTLQLPAETELVLLGWIIVALLTLFTVVIKEKNITIIFINNRHC